jgi:hypothetical protein
MNGVLVGMLLVVALLVIVARHKASPRLQEVRILVKRLWKHK